MQYTSSEFFIETLVPSEELIISRTNLDGIITYVNDTFADISGYSAEELIGKPHNCIRHPDMPKEVFKTLWEDLHTKNKWSGVVKNLRKDQGYYWVYAEISGVYKNGELVEYKSIRTPISFEDKLRYQKEYDKLKESTNDTKRVVSYQ